MFNITKKAPKCDCGGWCQMAKGAERQTCAFPGFFCPSWEVNSVCYWLAVLTVVSYTRKQQETSHILKDLILWDLSRREGVFLRNPYVWHKILGQWLNEIGTTNAGKRRLWSCLRGSLLKMYFKIKTTIFIMCNWFCILGLSFRSY